MGSAPCTRRDSGSSPSRMRAFDPSARRPAQAAFDDIIAGSIALGGTVNAEPGIGLLKRAGLAAQVGPDVLAVYAAVKKAVDLAGILNPGTII
jgi:glycolate oxidase